VVDECPSSEAMQHDVRMSVLGQKAKYPQAAKGRKPKKAAAGQREMLMAISGKGEGKAKPAAEETKRPTHQRKAG
jgi:DNA end-binding protein Ku